MKNQWIGITITETAQKYIQSIIKKKINIQAIKITIKKSGCAGFRYELSLINNNNINNIKEYYIYNKNNITVYIPNKYMFILDNTTIDLIQKDNINISLTFKNKKIKNFCGCGDSFYIKK